MKDDLKQDKMFHDLINSFPEVAENHDLFMSLKDKPYKQVIEYHLNKTGCIGDDFVYNPDILALGCSITVPIGIPHGLSWPHLIKDELNSSLNVVAYVGGSVQRIVFNAIQHIVQYGAPKKIYFLLPSLDRSWIVTPNYALKNQKISNKNVTHKDQNYYEFDNFFWNENIDRYNNCNYNSYRFPGQSSFLYKDFLNIKRDIPLEYGFQNQISSLVSFFSLCKMMKIECVYYSWSRYFDELLLSSNLLEGVAIHAPVMSTNSYSSQESEKIQDGTNYYSNNIEHKKYWEVGLDKPDESRHPGMYTHVYMAERFLGKRLSQKTIDEAKC
jgi:hypothetical protein